MFKVLHVLYILHCLIFNIVLLTCHINTYHFIIDRFIRRAFTVKGFYFTHSVVWWFTLHDTMQCACQVKRFFLSLLSCDTSIFSYRSMSVGDVLVLALWYHSASVQPLTPRLRAPAHLVIKTIKCVLPFWCTLIIYHYETYCNSNDIQNDIPTYQSTKRPAVAYAYIYAYTSISRQATTSTKQPFLAVLIYSMIFNSCYIA